MKIYLKNTLILFLTLTLVNSLLSCNKKQKGCSQYLHKILAKNSYPFTQISEKDTLHFCQGIRDAQSEDSLKYHRFVSVHYRSSTCEYWSLQNQGIEVIESFVSSEIDEGYLYLLGYNSVMEEKIKLQIGIPLNELLTCKAPKDLIDVNKIHRELKNRLSILKKEKNLTIKIDTNNSILGNIISEIDIKMVEVFDSSETATKIETLKLVEGINIKNIQSDLSDFYFLLNFKNITYQKFCKTSERRTIWFDGIQKEINNE